MGFIEYLFQAYVIVSCDRVAYRLLFNVATTRLTLACKDSYWAFPEHGWEKMCQFSITWGTQQRFGSFKIPQDGNYVEDHFA